MLKQLSVLSCALMLCSCTSYLSDYERQDMPYEVLCGSKAYTGSVISENFWQSFQDHKLDALMTQALLNNYDMRTAAVNAKGALSCRYQWYKPSSDR